MNTDAGQGRELTDTELIRLDRTGDPSAFPMLSERYTPLIKARASRYSRVVGVDIEDFVQDGMLALFKAVKNFDDAMGTQFRTYAVTCINNAMTTAVKTHMKNHDRITDVSIDDVREWELELPPQGKPRLIEDMFIDQENSAMLAGQIQSLLSNLEQQVLKLYLRGNSYLEISQSLSTSTKAVDNALQRVRRKLQPE